MARNPTSPSARPRTRRSSEAIAAALLDAATVEFAAHGYEGASTRRIAERAGAHQPQINYHFRSKEHLWQEVVDRLFGLMAIDAGTATVVTVAEGRGRDDADPRSRALAATLRRFVLFSAEHPELNRIINLEATAPSHRLDWLVATHLRPLYALLDAAWTELRAAGLGAELTSAEVWELTTSYGALHFANEPMLAALGISAGVGRAGAEVHADRLLAVIFP